MIFNYEANFLLKRILYESPLWLYGNYLTRVTFPVSCFLQWGTISGKNQQEDMLPVISVEKVYCTQNLNILSCFTLYRHSRCGNFFEFNSTSNGEDRTRLLDDIHPAIGAGSRIMLNKLSKTRLQLDAALGKEGPALYFGIRETF